MKKNQEQKPHPVEIEVDPKAPKLVDLNNPYLHRSDCECGECKEEHSPEYYGE